MTLIFTKYWGQEFSSIERKIISYKDNTKSNGMEKNSGNTQPPCCRHRHLLINNKTNTPLGRLSCKCSPLRFLMPSPSAKNKLPETMTTPANHHCMPRSPHTWKNFTWRRAHQNYCDFKRRTLSQAWPGNYLQFLYGLFCLKNWQFILKRTKLDG